MLDSTIKCRILKLGKFAYSFLFITWLVLVVVGCSSDTTELNPDPEAKEIVATKNVDIDSPEHVLVAAAKNSYQNRLYSVAKDQFTAIKTNFPTGPYVDFAELKVADCEFFLGEYDLSAPLYEEYAKNHTGNLSAAYALLMAARSYHLSSKGIGHDAHALEKARETYSKLIELYPESPYSKQAKLFQKEAIDVLTANERAIADYYQKIGADEAYASRIKSIEEKWDPLAKEIQKDIQNNDSQLVEHDSSPQPSSVVRAVPAPEVASNIDPVPMPESIEVSEAKIEKAKVSTEPIVNIKDDNQKSKVMASNLINPNLKTNRITISRFECSNMNLFLYLSRKWEDIDYLKSNSIIEPIDGIISITLPNINITPGDYSCFNDNDLKVSKDGTITIANSKPMFVRALMNPPKLALITKRFDSN